MSLIFWIALGSGLAVLLLGLYLRSRTRNEPVWKELVDPNALRQNPSPEPPPVSDEAKRFDIPIDSHPKSHGEAMNTPTQSSRPTRDADLRRSSRVEQAVPLVILATNRRGEIFQERTSAVAVNLHGCRYSSRHDVAPEGWVTLQVTGTDGASSRPMRARVRSVFSPQSSRELCQVGVELETPGNVWGIPAPPEDWQRLLDSSNSSAREATAVAPALDASSPSDSFFDRQPAPSDRRAEVTVFPGPPAAAPAAPESSLPKELPPSKTERVVVTAEQLLQALQGKIQVAADKAVQASLSSQLDEAVKSALAKIEDGWRTNLRQTEEFSAARLAEAQSVWEKELVVYRSRAEEIARRVEALTANSQQALAETQKFLQRFASETAPPLHARLSDSLAQANTEFAARAAEVSAQQLTQLTESSQLAAREARAHLDETIAEVRSLLSSAGAGPSQERVDSLLNSFRTETFNRLEQRLGELQSAFEQQHDLVRHRTNDVADQLEGLALETRLARSQHEQNISDLGDLLSKAPAGVPREQLDSLLHSSREQILSHLEWRLGEVSGHYEHLLERAHNRADELAQQLEKFSAETRNQLADTRSVAERASRDLQAQDLSAIDQSLSHATQVFETAAARVSDRQLIRWMEQKQAVSQEVSLELEARASEARALLQKASNSTLEEFRRRIETQIDLIIAEATERVTSSLASLDAESRAAGEARRRALEADVARAAEQSTMEFRSGIKAFLYSCLVAAVSAVDQHAQTTLAGLSNDPASLQPALEATNSSPSPEDRSAPPKSASASQ